MLFLSFPHVSSAGISAGICYICSLLSYSAGANNPAYATIEHVMEVVYGDLEFSVSG